jgi:hypothetical protein
MTSDTSAGIDDNQNADVVCEQCTFYMQDNNYRITIPPIVTAFRPA